MNSIKIPQETLNLINGHLNSLGDLSQLGKGYKNTNGLQGQIEVPNKYAARDLRSTPLQYTAEVVEKDNRLEWEIITILAVGFDGLKVIW